VGALHRGILQNRDAEIPLLEKRDDSCATARFEVNLSGQKGLAVPRRPGRRCTGARLFTPSAWSPVGVRRRQVSFRSSGTPASWSAWPRGHIEQLVHPDDLDQRAFLTLEVVSLAVGCARPGRPGRRRSRSAEQSRGRSIDRVGFEGADPVLSTRRRGRVRTRSSHSGEAPPGLRPRAGESPGHWRAPAPWARTRR
jgi:hypothetical protein